MINFTLIVFACISGIHMFSTMDLLFYHHHQRNDMSGLDRPYTCFNNACFISLIVKILYNKIHKVILVPFFSNWVGGLMQKRIFLFGDQVIHWNIVPAAGRKNIYCEPWGTASTKRILDAISAYFTRHEAPLDWSLMNDVPDSGVLASISPTDHSFNHVFATWKQYNQEISKPWRIQEIIHVGQAVQPPFDEAVLQNAKEADLVIMQDWGMTIRNYEAPGLGDVLRDKWVIIRAFPPIFEGNLWQDIQKGVSSKGVFLVRADDLRELNTSISKGLSWEQTIQDIINEIYFKRNISLYPLRMMEYVLISFGCSGTVLIHNPIDSPGENPSIKFFFDPMGMEGYWEKAHPGYLPGDLELLSALLAKEILYPLIGSDVQLSRAIRAHLLTKRALLLHGADVPKGSLAFELIPAELIKVYGTEPTQEFIPVPLDYSHFQTIFKVDQNNHAPTVSKEWSLLGMTKWDLYSLARQIALNGPMKALQGWNIPIARFNFLLTVDRKEIEFLHHLKTLISEYLQNKNNQPLSIAVFGAPGSGKSFSIKQLAKSLDLPEQEIKDITFNLSQFNEDNPGDLYQAFHAVRDISLSGKIPLVFWDEFDSKNLAWLRYFLAPMQDGEFQEGQLIHNIGKSIFVFAGGTCSCMEEFEEKAQHARSEKGPDFLSRIKGFINVMGPNPTLCYDDQMKNLPDKDDDTHMINLAKNADPEYVIRRAILINSLLQLGYKHLFEHDVLQIDEGVLNALLLVPRFKHGTRSMETIFKTSQLFGKDKYHRSDLPPESQMDLHVNGQQFFELLSQKPKYYEGGEAFYYLVNEITFDEKVVEKMAVGIHNIYTLVFSTGKEKEPLTITKEEFLAQSEKMKNLPAGMPHDEVSQNYHNARKIPEKLAAVGFAIVPLDSNIPADDLNDEEFEKVSRLEHIRWVHHHIDAGWSYAPEKNKTNKQHDALIAWDEIDREQAETIYGKGYSVNMGLSNGEFLSEHYRNLDRVITMAIPWILETVGYKMVRLQKR